MDYKVIILIVLLWPFYSFSQVDEIMKIEEQLKFGAFLSDTDYQNIHTKLIQLKKQNSDKPIIAKEVSKLQRISYIQFKLEKCLDGGLAGSQLGRRVLSFLFNIESKNLDCDLSLPSPLSAITESHLEFTKSRFLNIQKQVHNNAIKNALSNLVDINFRLKPKKLTDERLIRTSIEKVCRRYDCDEALRAEMSSSAKEQIYDLRKIGVQPKTYTQVAQRLNSELRGLNDIINQPISGSESQAEEKAYFVYERLKARYWDVVSKGEGLLLLSAENQDKAGEMESFDGVRRASGITIKNMPVGRQAYKIRHSEFDANLSPEDIQASRQDYERSLLEVVEQTQAQNISRDKSLEEISTSLGESLYLNPLAGAQYLLHNPEQVHEVCDAINSYESSAMAKKEASQTRRILSATAAGVLVGAGVVATATGVGSAAGVPLMAAGWAVSGYEMGATAYDLHQTQGVINQLENSQLTGNMDVSSFEDKLELDESAADDVLSLGLGAGLSVVGLSGLAHGVAVGKKAFNLPSNISRNLSDLPRQPFSRRAKSYLTDTEHGELLGLLSTVPQNLKNEVIKDLQKAQTRTQFKDILDELRKAKNC